MMVTAKPGWKAGRLQSWASGPPPYSFISHDDDDDDGDPEAWLEGWSAVELG